MNYVKDRATQAPIALRGRHNYAKDSTHTHTGGVSSEQTITANKGKVWFIELGENVRILSHDLHSLFFIIIIILQCLVLHSL